MFDGSEIMPVKADVGLTFGRAEMQTIRWMCFHERQKDE